MTSGIIEAHESAPPDILVFDPLVSFGASEQAVNDNEQALVTAARRLVRQFGCCVRYVHHTGKVNARASTTDQYSGRGGSALPDGCRMVCVLTKEDKLARQGSEFVRLTRSKLSFAPRQPDILIERNGWAYSHQIERPADHAAELRAQCDQVWNFLTFELGLERRYSGRALSDHAKQINLSRDVVRAVVERLRLDGRVIDEPLPKTEKKGRRQSFLLPVKPESVSPWGYEIDDPIAREVSAQ